jgi:hypothetical protein
MGHRGDVRSERSKNNKLEIKTFKFVESNYYGPHAPRRYRNAGEAHPRRKGGFSISPESGPAGLEFIGWYEPAIGEQGREPDFVLFGNQHGLLILEVKDCLISQ